MKARFVIAAVVVGLALTPVVLSIGALVLIPLALVILPIALIFGLGALPVLLLASARETEPGWVRPDARGHSQLPASAV